MLQGGIFQRALASFSMDGHNEIIIKGKHFFIEADISLLTSPCFFGILQLKLHSGLLPSTLKHEVHHGYISLEDRSLLTRESRLPLWLVATLPLMVKYHHLLPAIMEPTISVNTRESNSVVSYPLL